MSSSPRSPYVGSRALTGNASIRFANVASALSVSVTGLMLPERVAVDAALVDLVDS